MGVVITGTGLFTPKEKIGNHELVHTFNQYVDQYNHTHAVAIEKGELTALEYSSVEFIEKASGIQSRFVINKEGILDPNRMCPNVPERSNDVMSIQCEMAVEAISEALRNSGRTPADIDAVIVACSNMQRPYPAIAIEVQQAIGANGYAFDMNVACSSATFGIQTAKDAILSGSAQCVVVVNPEICTGHLAWEDRDCHFIFGDACTAIVLEDERNAKKGWRIIDSQLLTRFSNNIRNNFGFLNRADPKGIGKRDKLFMQEGRKVFKEVCPMVSDFILQQLQRLKLSPQDIERMWLHQANQTMNELVCRKVWGEGYNSTRAPIILDRYANTSSAGSIIAFHLYHDNMPLGSKGLICSFGAGYSVGSVVVEQWSAH